MQPSLFSIRLVPGTEAEYDRRHAVVWPEMVAAMHACGIRNSTGFRRGTEVFYYAECDPDPITCSGRLEGMDVNQRWTEHFAWIDGGVRIQGLTPTGRATVAALRLNNPYIVPARRLWVVAGWHPPA